MDEIGDISPYMQQSLLRVLQEKEIQPIGGTSKKIDVRIIGASHQDLPELCQQGRFRWDLYYRLAVVELELPKLAERGKGELKQLLTYFIETIPSRLNRKNSLKLDKRAEQVLMKYWYPGTIRELENIVLNLYVFCEDTVRAEDIPKRIAASLENHPLTLKEVEKRHILYISELCEGRKQRAADMLGIALNTYKKKLKEYDGG